MDLTLKKIKTPSYLLRPLEIAKILLHDMTRADVFKHASAMAYVTLFSLIPSLAATFSVIALFKPFLGEDSELLALAKNFILSNLAAGSGEQVIQYIESFLANLDIGKIGITGFVGIVFTLILLLRQIEIALNMIWLVRKPRNPLTRFIYFWTFLTLGTFVIGLSVGIVSGFSLASLNPFGNTVDVRSGFLAEVVPFVSAFVFFTMTYKIVPNCFVTLKDAAFGAIPASIIFTLATKLYGWYAGNLTNYKAIYGAMAALPSFLFWLYILWLITLFGSLLSWRSQQGFALSDDMDDKNRKRTPEEKLRNHQIQAVSPYLALLAIYQKFASGDGKGVSGLELTQKLNLPAPWVTEALDVLTASGFVVASQDQSGKLVSGDLKNKYFPAFPADNLSVGELRAKLNVGATHWLDQWDHKWPIDFKPVVAMVWGSDAKLEAKDLKTKLSELLKKEPEPKAKKA
jgi:membrane protein